MPLFFDSKRPTSSVVSDRDDHIATGSSGGIGINTSTGNATLHGVDDFRVGLDVTRIGCPARFTLFFVPPLTRILTPLDLRCSRRSRSVAPACLGPYYQNDP